MLANQASHFKHGDLFLPNTASESGIGIDVALVFVVLQLMGFDVNPKVV